MVLFSGLNPTTKINPITKMELRVGIMFQENLIIELFKISTQVHVAFVDRNS